MSAYGGEPADLPREPWFRQHPTAVLAVAGVLFASVWFVRLFDADAVDASTLLFTLPVALIAVAFGFFWLGVWCSSWFSFLIDHPFWSPDGYWYLTYSVLVALQFKYPNLLFFWTLGGFLVSWVLTSLSLAARRGGSYVWMRPYKAFPVNLPELTGWSSGQFFGEVVSLGFFGSSLCLSSVLFFLV